MILILTGAAFSLKAIYSSRRPVIMYIHTHTQCHYTIRNELELQVHVSRPPLLCYLCMCDCTWIWDGERDFRVYCRSCATLVQ